MKSPAPGSIIVYLVSFDIPKSYIYDSVVALFARCHIFKLCYSGQVLPQTHKTRPDPAPTTKSPQIQALCFKESYLPKFHELQSRFEWLNAFFRSYHSFLVIEEKCTELDSKYKNLSPFTHLNNVLLYDTVINWCKIFGSHSEECHWKRVVKDPDDFRAYLFNSIGKTQQEFNEYHKEIIEFRNKWVVHFDPNYKHPEVPFFVIANDSAVALHSYLKEQSNKEYPYGGPENIEKFGKDVARVLFSNLLREEHR